MNFNNIPEGLRTPLFFGEISINGTVPTVSDNGEDPIPSQISCTGATATFKVQHLLKNGIVDETLLKLFIDGVLWGDDQEVPAWLEITLLKEQYTGEIPLGFDLYLGVIEFKNNDTQNHRIEFKSDPTLGRNLMFDNPSVIELGAILGEHVGVCLSPSTPNIISCIGATSILNLLTSQPTAPLEYEYWRFEVSDAITGQVYSMVNNLNRLETENLDQSLERLKSVNCPLSFSQTAEPNFFMVIQNTSNQDVRIKIKFKKLIQDDEPDVIELYVGNGSTPTLTWEKQVNGEDYEILACLAANSPSLISCNGATSVVRILPDLQYLVIENGQEININWKVEIDGVLYPDVIHTWESDEAYFLQDFIEANMNQIGITSRFVDSPFEHFLEIKLLSSTLVPKRIRLIPDRSFVNQMNFSDNPTISIDETGIITFCLEHSSNNLISCEGTTQRIDFEYISGTWQFFIDDLEEMYFEGLAGHFISEVSTDYPNLHSDYDGYFWMENVDTQNHRVKMIPVEGTSYLNVTNNPTFVEHEDGSLTFCLAAYPDRLFNYARVDKGETNKVEVYFDGSNIGTIDITDPNGTITQYTPIANQPLVIDYVEGFYTFHSNDGFLGTVGDVYFKASLANQAHPMPVISNITRDANNIVTIVGTAQTFTVVQIEPDESSIGEALAYAKVLDGETDFTFVLELPPNFSGFIRCRDGNTGSALAPFTI